MDILRQKQSANTRFGPFALFPMERLLQRDGESIALGSRALDILIALVERAGEVVPRQELIQRVWPDLTIDESGLRVHIAGLRKALGEGRDGARYISNVPGRGYCFVAPVQRHEVCLAETEGGESRLLLPPTLERMVGRDDEIAEISDVLATTRFVTIAGAGGIGKTTIAVAVAHRVADRFPDGAYFIDLGGISDGSLLAGTIAAVLGLPLAGQDPSTSLLALLTGRRLLLLLDNCEHIVSAAASLAEEIHIRGLQVAVLATSREALRAEGEHVYQLPPLNTPPLNMNLAVADILTFPAVQLFIERAVASGSRGCRSDSDIAKIAEICSRLDGVALAIELAAGRVGTYGIEGTAGLLDHRFRLQWQGRRTALARHQTLRALVDWSYNLLSSEERNVLRALSVFAGNFSSNAALAVAKGELEEERILELIEELINKSLIAVVPAQGDRLSYRLLETTKTFAEEKLRESGDLEDVAARHATYFSEILSEAERSRPVFRVAVGARASAVHLANIRSALNWCVADSRRTDVGRELLANSAFLFLDLALVTECYRWIKQLLEYCSTELADPSREMTILEALALCAMFISGASDEAHDAFIRALQLAEELNDRKRQIRLLAGLNLFLTRNGECQAGLRAAEQSKRVSDSISDPDGTMVSEWMLGISHSLIGNPSVAQSHLEQGFSRWGHCAGEMNFIGYAQLIRARVHLARVQWLQGYPDRAVASARAALADAESHNHPINMCICLVHTTSVFMWRGDWSHASEAIAKLADFAERHDLAPFRAVSVGFRGELLVRTGNAVAGNFMLKDGLNAMEIERHKVMATSFSVALADGLSAIEEFDEALRIITAAINDAERAGEKFEMPEMLRVKGNILRASLRAPAECVGRCLNASLQSARSQTALGWELRSAMSLAELLRSQGRVSDAYGMLAPVYGRFTEGFETTDLRAGAALLAELAPALPAN